jgi:amino acid transporter
LEGPLMSEHPASEGLRRDLSARELFSLAFGAIVGVSWIILVGQWVSSAGAIGAVLAFVIGGLLLIPVGYCYAELGQRLPAAGGEFVYAYRFLGEGAAFLTAWILALLYIAVCAFEAISISWITFEIWPSLRGIRLYEFGGEAIHLGDIVVGVIWTLFFAWLQLRGAQLAATIQDLMVYAMLVCAIAFLGAAIWRGDVENLKPAFDASGEGFLALLLITPLFFAGFGSVPQALGESSENAIKRIPTVILVVLLASIVFYAGVVLATALVLPASEAMQFEFPAAEAFQRAFGSQAFTMAAMFTGLLGLLTTWNAILYSASRVLFAIGHGRLAPPWLGQVSQKTGAPVPAIILVTGLTLVAIPFGRALIVPVISLGGVCITLMFVLVAACSFISRRQAHAGVSAQLFKPMPVIAGVVALALLGLNIYQLATTEGASGPGLVLRSWGRVALNERNSYLRRQWSSGT